MSGRKSILLAVGLGLFLGTQHFAGCACDDGGGDTPGPTPCLNDGDCGTHGTAELCNDDVGECFPGDCRVDRDCGMGSACKDNWCSGTCTTDADCQAEGNSDAACYLHVCYGMEETCSTDADCAQPIASHSWVTCSDLKGKCVSAIPTCTRGTLEDDCPADMVCKGEDGTCDTGVCAERPAQCMTDCDCPAELECNASEATCRKGSNCDPGKRPDPVDGICRTAICDKDLDCANGEWCDFFYDSGCRKDCTSDNDCVTSEGEKCNLADNHCIQAVLCGEDEDCSSCACDTGLVCATDHRIGTKKCRRSCDIFDNDCANQGELCQPVLDGDTYPRNGGACQIPNGGRAAGAACDPANHCEANLLCQNLSCRAICNPGGAPGCDAGVDCTAYLGIGVCGDVVGCNSDIECNPPAEVCWNDDCQPGCHELNTPINCDGAHPCDASTGRCQGSGICEEDIDCDPPTSVCDVDCQPPDCVPGCLSTGCPGGKACAQTTGRCEDKCLSDNDCVDPPKEICQGDACIKGCNEVGGLDCGAQDCMLDGHCGDVNYCTVDSDCNPPMTRCDEAWGQCEDGCGLTQCDSAQGYVCENTTGDCVYSPCDYIGCACTSVADCQAGLLCLGFGNKECTKSCTSDADCAPFYCNAFGYCKP